MSRTHSTKPARLLKRTGSYVCTAQELAETAAVVGYAPGLASQIARSE